MTLGDPPLRPTTGLVEHVVPFLATENQLMSSIPQLGTRLPPLRSDDVGGSTR